MSFSTILNAAASVGSGVSAAGTLQETTDLGASTSNKVTLQNGVSLDALNASYTANPHLLKRDYFVRNFTPNPEDPDYDEDYPYKSANPSLDGMTVNGLSWAYQSLEGEPLFAVQEINGIASDKGSINSRFVIGNVSTVGGIGEPVWTIGYVDDGDSTTDQNMYKKGDGTNTNGILTSDFKPILSLEPSGTIAAVRSANLASLNDPDKVTHAAGSMFEGFFNGDVKPVFRIQGTIDPLDNTKGGALIEFGPAGNRETDFQLSRWTNAQNNIRVNNQNFMNWVNHPGWRRGVVLENGCSMYFIGEGNKVQEEFTATQGQQTFTIAQDISGVYDVKDVVIGDMFLRDNIWSIVGQDLTIPTETESPGYGIDINAGDVVKIILADDHAEQEISMKNVWNDANQRSELTVAGVMRVTDILNGAGDSAFAGGGGSGVTIVDMNDANTYDNTNLSVGFNIGTTNFPAGVQYGQTLNVAGNGDTSFQLTSAYGSDGLYWRGASSDGANTTDWYQVASRDYVDTAVAGVGNSGLVAFLTAEQNAVQNFTADTDTTIEFGNIPEDTIGGWDGVNNYFVCDSTLNGAVANIVLTTEMNGAVASGSIMQIMMEYSNNAGVNWAPICRDAGVDFYGIKTVNGMVKVQTGTLLRARLKFIGNARTSWGNSGVSMRISFHS